MRKEPTIGMHTPSAWKLIAIVTTLILLTSGANALSKKSIYLFPKDVYSEYLSDIFPSGDASKYSTDSELGKLSDVEELNRQLAEMGSMECLHSRYYKDTKQEDLILSACFITLRLWKVINGTNVVKIQDYELMNGFEITDVAYINENLIFSANLTSTEATMDSGKILGLTSLNTATGELIHSTSLDMKDWGNQAFTSRVQVSPFTSENKIMVMYQKTEIKPQKKHSSRLVFYDLDAGNVLCQLDLTVANKFVEEIGLILDVSFSDDSYMFVTYGDSLLKEVRTAQCKISLTDKSAILSECARTKIPTFANGRAVVDRTIAGNPTKAFTYDDSTKRITSCNYDVISLSVTSCDTSYPIPKPEGSEIDRFIISSAGVSLIVTDIKSGYPNSIVYGLGSDSFNLIRDLSAKSIINIGNNTVSFGSFSISCWGPTGDFRVVVFADSITLGSEEFTITRKSDNMKQSFLITVIPDIDSGVEIDPLSAVKVFTNSTNEVDSMLRGNLFQGNCLNDFSSESGAIIKANQKTTYSSNMNGTFVPWNVNGFVYIGYFPETTSLLPIVCQGETKINCFWDDINPKFIKLDKDDQILSVDDASLMRDQGASVITTNSVNKSSKIIFAGFNGESFVKELPMLFTKNRVVYKYVDFVHAFFVVKPQTIDIYVALTAEFDTMENTPQTQIVAKDVGIDTFLFCPNKVSVDPVNPAYIEILSTCPGSTSSIYIIDVSKFMTESEIKLVSTKRIDSVVIDPLNLSYASLEGEYIIANKEKTEIFYTSKFADSSYGNALVEQKFDFDGDLKIFQTTENAAVIGHENSQTPNNNFYMVLRGGESTNARSRILYYGNIPEGYSLISVTGVDGKIFSIMSKVGNPLLNGFAHLINGPTVAITGLSSKSVDFSITSCTGKGYNFTINVEAINSPCEKEVKVQAKKDTNPVKGVYDLEDLVTITGPISNITLVPDSKYENEISLSARMTLMNKSLLYGDAPQQTPTEMKLVGDRLVGYSTSFTTTRFYYYNTNNTLIQIQDAGCQGSSHATQYLPDGGIFSVIVCDSSLKYLVIDNQGNVTRDYLAYNILDSSTVDVKIGGSTGVTVSLTDRKISTETRIFNLKIQGVDVVATEGAIIKNTYVAALISLPNSKASALLYTENAQSDSLSWALIGGSATTRSGYFGLEGNVTIQSLECNGDSCIIDSPSFNFRDLRVQEAGADGIKLGASKIFTRVKESGPIIGFGSTLIIISSTAPTSTVHIYSRDPSASTTLYWSLFLPPEHGVFFASCPEDTLVLLSSSATYIYSHTDLALTLSSSIPIEALASMTLSLNGGKVNTSVSNIFEVKGTGTSSTSSPSTQPSTGKQWWRTSWGEVSIGAVGVVFVLLVGGAILFFVLKKGEDDDEDDDDDDENGDKSGLNTMGNTNTTPFVTVEDSKW